MANQLQEALGHPPNESTNQSPPPPPKQPIMANQLQEALGQPPKESTNQSPPPTPTEVKIKMEVMDVVAPDNASDMVNGSEVTDQLERSAYLEREEVDEEDEDDYLSHEYANGVDDERFSPMSAGNMEFAMMSGDLIRSEDYQPFRDVEGNQVLEVDCGSNRALLYINKLCQGSKGQCILFENRWHTPNEFQYVSGRETAKDWKRSIRHRGKSLKIHMSRGLLQARSRPSDKRNGSNGCLTTLNNSASDKKTQRKLGMESEPSQLNQIINHLHQTNGSHLLGPREAPRKRSLPTDYTYRNGKRSRSTSPTEGDIYDEQQRCIFQAANSPEPQNIENARKSLNLGTNSPESPSSSTSGQSSPLSFVLGDPQSLTTYNKHDMTMAHKSRKQNSPQHFEMQGLGEKEREVNRSPHIVLVSASNSAAFPKGLPAIRPRFHSHQPGTRFNGNALIQGPQQPLPAQGEGNNRRTQSLLTPTTKTPSVKMIELTRPDAVPKTPAFPDNRNNSAHNSTQNVGDISPLSRTPNNDTVFLPSDMSLWTVDDVAQFIHSLKGCEEYVQVFRDQAIDGEILPVLTEDHLLQNMGLKLGPALKIRLRVARRLGFTLDGQYCQLKPPYEEPPPTL